MLSWLVLQSGTALVPASAAACTTRAVPDCSTNHSIPDRIVVNSYSHWWSQTGVTVRKRPIWLKFDDILSRVKFGKWPWKTIGHLFNATSNFVHHFVAIGEFKLELQSGNAQFGSNSTIFRAVWPCNLTYDLENNRAILLCYFKLCTSFRSHWWIQTGVTVRKRPFWVKFDDV